ncbi:unnamed protein product, partial [Darwinula stevensoni]
TGCDDFQVAEGMEWLATSDILNREVRHSQVYNLVAYMPYVCVAFHFLFSSLQYPKLSFPNAQFEVLLAPLCPFLPLSLAVWCTSGRCLSCWIRVLKHLGEVRESASSAALLDSSTVQEASGRQHHLEKLQDNTSDPARFYHVLHVAQSFGDYEKVFRGMHENFLNIKFKDTHMQAVAEGMEWLATSDILNREVRHSQVYNLVAYMPYVCVAFHFLFSSLQYPKLSFPNAQFEVAEGMEWLATSDILNREVRHSQVYNLVAYMPYVCVAFHFLFSSLQYPKLSFPNAQFEWSQKRSHTGNVLDTLIHEGDAHARRHLSRPSLVLDIVPFLVNSQLYSGKEKAELKALIETMMSLNVTYVQERSPEGQYVFKLDP